MGILADRTNNKLEKSNLINEDVLNREPVPLIVTSKCKNFKTKLSYLLAPTIILTVVMTHDEMIIRSHSLTSSNSYPSNSMDSH